MRLEDVLADLTEAELAALNRRFSELLTKFPLAKLRESLGLSQLDMGQKLGISQVAVSRMEARTDIKLSSMWKYVAATGGRVRVDISYPEKSFSIEKDADGDFSLVMKESLCLVGKNIHSFVGVSEAKSVPALPNSAWAASRTLLLARTDELDDHIAA